VCVRLLVFLQYIYEHKQRSVVNVSVCSSFVRTQAVSLRDVFKSYFTNVIALYLYKVIYKLLHFLGV